MLWPVLIAGIVGLITGLRFRAPALAFFAAFMIAATVAVGLLDGWPSPTIFLSAITVLFAINCGYVLGILIAPLFLSKNSGPRAHRRSAIRN
jgi:hypothetical protein